MNKEENSTNPAQNGQRSGQEEASPDCSSQPAPEQAQARAQTKLAVSEARLAANRRNAKKSTGPKTKEGKAHSRKNATKHGLRARLIAEEELWDPFLCEMLERLEEEYGGLGPVADFSIDLALADAWRYRQGLALEIRNVQHSGFFDPSGPGTNIHRYSVAARNGLQKSLHTLEEIRASNSTRNANKLEKTESEDEKGNRDEAGGQRD